MQSIVAFQGLGPRDWASLYRVPEIKAAIQWGQEILSAHNIRVEGHPLDIIKACEENGLVLQEHSQTCWQQPCIFLASMAYWKMWRERHPNIRPLLLGFSFGEWTAAAAAGCMDEETGLLIATMRGLLTSSAGGSSLIISVSRENTLPIKRIRLRCKITGGVWLANINSSTQGLISGQKPALSEIEESLKIHHPAIRVRPFSVGGAFHTPLMRKARDQFAKWLEQVEFQKPEFPLLLNATRETTRDPERIKRMLLRQLSARLNFKKLAEGLSKDLELHELCLESPIIGPLIQQTRQVKYGAASKLTALPFPT